MRKMERNLFVGKDLIGALPLNALMLASPVPGKAPHGQPLQIPGRVVLTPRGGCRKSQCGEKARPSRPLYLLVVSQEWCFPVTLVHLSPRLPPYS